MNKTILKCFDNPIIPETCRGCLNYKEIDKLIFKDKNNNTIFLTKDKENKLILLDLKTKEYIIIPKMAQKNFYKRILNNNGLIYNNTYYALKRLKYYDGSLSIVKQEY